MNHKAPRLGEIATATGVVRAVEALHPAGHYRVTLDVAPQDQAAPTCRHRIPVGYYCGSCGGAARQENRPTATPEPNRPTHNLEETP